MLLKISKIISLSIVIILGCAIFVYGNYVKVSRPHYKDVSSGFVYEFEGGGFYVSATDIEILIALVVCLIFGVIVTNRLYRKS
jgi:hypothetical protein